MRVLDNKQHVYPKMSITRVINDPVLRLPELVLPGVPIEHKHMTVLSPSEQICVNNILENLFEFFQSLGFRITSERPTK